METLPATVEAVKLHQFECRKKEAGQIDLIETNKPVISGSAPGRDHSNNWRWVGHLGAAKWFAGNSGKMHWLNKKVRQLTA